MPAREFDVALYGASGFTGRQTVAYFARHAPAGLRWAIAGRNRAKLEAVRAEVGGRAAAAPVLVAEGHDQPALDDIASRSRVVLSTAGPFAVYGTPLVDACVRFGTQYVDISGETAWVRGLIDRYHARAAAEGTRIVPCCGFDSVPSDIGTLLLARHVQAALGAPCAEVRAYFQLYGGLNGGTIATSLTMAESESARLMDEPFLLDPPHPRPHWQVERSRDVTSPRREPELGAWVGPFLMAPTNTRVVRRSAALFAGWGEPYGPDFVYQEFQKYDPPLAPAKAAAMTALVALIRSALRSPLARRLAAPLLPKPGTGPSPRVLERGWFTCELWGTAPDGRRARAFIRQQGDPSNRATVLFLCESALALAVDGEALPGGRARGGVLTPATALGDVLAERLRRAGVEIEVGS
ncbi:MAG TPA: saccharopine dehydrogenase NADP-binding domain-containing protein [Longimicrobiales bacterium]|nr:saccharopine dehydrogenase NADP-binding domain-containing protein [Longimicrobiales bacterium]